MTNKRKRENDDKNFICPCGDWDQSCIVARRRAGDFVHEDMLMAEAGVKKRRHCLSKMTKKQQEVMDKFEKEMKDGEFDCICFRWDLDCELE